MLYSEVRVTYSVHARACALVRLCTTPLVSLLCWAFPQIALLALVLDKFASANLVACWRASKPKAALFSLGLLGIRLAGFWTLVSSAFLEGGWSSS